MEASTTITRNTSNSEEPPGSPKRAFKPAVGGLSSMHGTPDEPKDRSIGSFGPLSLCKTLLSPVSLSGDGTT